MEAPHDVCRKLALLDPNIRLAYDYPSESFALVELWPATRVGPLEAPWIVHELWDLTDGVDKWKKPLRKQIARGPIYTQTGRPNRDWDLLSKIPVYRANLKQHGWPPLAVNSTAFVKTVEYWLTPMRERHERSIRTESRDLQRQIDDISREGADFLWSKARKSDQTTPLTTKEERIAAQKAIEAKRAGFKNFAERKAFV